MTAKRKILLFLFCLFVLLVSSAYLLVATQGKKILIRQLEILSHRTVTMDSFAFKFPCSVAVKGLNIEGLASFESFSASLSLIGLTTGQVILNEVVADGPNVRYERVISKAPDAGEASSISLPTGSYVRKIKERRRALRRPLFIKSLLIRNGALEFIDRGASADGIKIRVKDYSVKLTNAYSFPSSLLTSFDIRGTIPWEASGESGSFALEGWINIPKRSMEARLRVEGIDGLYLYPYYSNWVDIDKTNIEKAKLNFTSEIHAVSNEVTAPCHLELVDITFKKENEDKEAKQAEKIATAVLDILKTLNQGKIVLDFTLRTKMDNPEFAFGAIKLAFEDKLPPEVKQGPPKADEVLVFPLRLLEGVFKSSADLSKAALSGSFAVGNVIKESFKASFRREPSK